jgi:MoxR-like ATPase
MQAIEQQVEQLHINLENLQREISKIIVGHQEVIRDILITLLAGGHALLEGVPGIGKTLMVRTLSRSLGLKFSRIQFTPDLMPADILGTNIIVEDPGGKRSFRFHHGPVFGNIILADEINRATPKTQSALLEAMQEYSVTIYGMRYELERPFLVLATQNPIEMEGTYPLPEAQLDRFFFKIQLNLPNLEELVQIMDRTTGADLFEPLVIFDAQELMSMQRLVRQVPVANHVYEYVARLILATHPEHPQSVPMTRRYVRYGSSPRGAQALILAGKILAIMKGRYNVSINDVREVCYPALRHRLILNFEGKADGIAPEQIISQLLEEVLVEPGL